MDRAGAVGKVVRGRAPARSPRALRAVSLLDPMEKGQKAQLDAGDRTGRPSLRGMRPEPGNHSRGVRYQARLPTLLRPAREP